MRWFDVAYPTGRAQAAGAATAPEGRAEGHAVGWRAARCATGARQLKRDRERRDSQLDGPNAPGWAASEERATTSVRRAGGEATLQALAFTGPLVDCKELSARSVASAELGEQALAVCR